MQPSVRVIHFFFLIRSVKLCTMGKIVQLTDTHKCISVVQCNECVCLRMSACVCVRACVRANNATLHMCVWMRYCGCHNATVRRASWSKEARGKKAKWKKTIMQHIYIYVYVLENKMVDHTLKTVHTRNERIIGELHPKTDMTAIFQIIFLV